MWMKRRGGKHTPKGRFLAKAGGTTYHPVASRVKAGGYGSAGAALCPWQAATNANDGAPPLAIGTARGNTGYAGEILAPVVATGLPWYSVTPLVPCGVGAEAKQIEGEVDVKKAVMQVACFGFADERFVRVRRLSIKGKLQAVIVKRPHCSGLVSCRFAACRYVFKGVLLLMESWIFRESVPLVAVRARASVEPAHGSWRSRALRSSLLARNEA